MKAISVTKLVKSPLELSVSEVPDHTPATCPADSVIIRVRGIGLNFLETLMIQVGSFGVNGRVG
jgi:NADPH:quinone reductase-like Zn-dependent oxidoreductase